MSTPATTPSPAALEQEQPVVVERATASDVEEIDRVLRRNADVRTLILQPRSKIARKIHEFLVVRGPGGTVLGCAQLRWRRPGIAEITSVAVLPSQQGEGLGQALVRSCVERAMRRSPRLVWLATESPEWFERIGFERMHMRSVPFRVLVKRFPSVFRQHPGRWFGTLFGPHHIMRWSGTGPGAGARDPSPGPTRGSHEHHVTNDTTTR